MERRTTDRVKRVRFLKKLIVGSVLALILLPTVLCVILIYRVNKIENAYALLREEQEQTVHSLDASRDLTNVLKDHVDELQNELADTKAKLLRLEEADKTESVEPEKLPATNPKKVYLTFDDGPSGHTRDILDILDRYGVKGNFFVCATPNEDYWKYYREILDEGHMLGLHSYSHEYDRIYASEEAFEEDVLAIRDFVKEKTDGYEATYYRFPGGSTNLHSRISLLSCVKWLNEQGLVYYDWNISSQDATNPMQSVENIVHNATYGAQNYEEVVILMHDLGNKDSTVEALPQIIEYYLDLGAKIDVINEDSMRIQHDK